MALSPGYFQPQWNLRSVASTLAGRGGEYDRWISTLTDAVDRGEIQPLSMHYIDSENDYQSLSLEDRESFNEARFQGEIFMMFERKEVYRWLKANDVPDENIPEEFRLMPRPDEAKKHEAEKGDADEILILEAFGLLLELFSKQAPQYQNGQKPNRSTIAEKMLEVVPKDVTKLKKRTLQIRLTQAFEAWEAKKRS